MKRIIYILFTLFSVQLSAQIEQPRIKFNQVIKDSTGVGHIVISSLDDSSMIYSADFYINPIDSTLVLFGTALGEGQLSSVNVDSIYLFGDGAANPIYLDKQRLLDSLSPFLSPNIAPGLGIDTAIVDNTVVIQSLRVEEYVKNVTTDSLYKGYPVYQVDSTIGGNAIGVALADASDPTKMPAVGILKQDLAPGEEGVMIFSGLIQGVNTLGFTSGDVVYVAVGGGYTNVPPKSEGNLIQNLGRVIKVHETNGSGIIMGAGRANAVPNLNPGNIFYGDVDSTATTINLPTLLSDSLSAYTPLTVLADSLSAYSTSAAFQQQFTAGGTSYTVTTADLPVDINNILVFQNGQVLDKTMFTKSGNTITLNFQPEVGDRIIVMWFKGDIVDIGGNYVTLDQTETITGAKKFTSDLNIDAKIALNDGGRSVYVGDNAGRIDDADNNRNIGIGYESLYNNLDGKYNVAIGYGVLKENTSGRHNIAIGYTSMFKLSSGDDNFGLGSAAGRYIGNTTSEITNANGSIFLGSSTRASADSNSNEIVIGYNAIGNGSNSITLGASTNELLVMKGRMELNAGDNNVVIGDGAGASLVSGQALGNVLIGTQAGATIDSADYNVANGYETLYNNTTGSYNTAIGYQALYNNTTASYNVAIGYQALRSDTTGIRNIGIGYNALFNNRSGNDNQAIGFQALQSNTSGDNNIANSRRAFFNLSSGSNNQAYGTDAGRYYGSGSSASDALTTANGSLFFGTNTRASADGNSNEIVIGTNAIGNGSNSVTIGNDGTIGTATSKTILNGNVGIGTSSPFFKLQMNGGAAVFASSNFDVTTTGGSVSVFSDDNNGGKIWALKDGNQAWGYLALQPLGGNVGIGTSTPDKKLHIKGDNTSSDIVFETGSSYTTKGYFAHYQGATLQLAINRDITGVFSNTGAAAAGINLTGNNGDGNFTVYTSATNNTSPTLGLKVDKNQNVGIGNIFTPTQKLDVNGKVRIRDLTASVSLDVLADANGVLGTSSDERLKIYDSDITDAISIVNSLYPKYYYWKDNAVKRDLGFYAQEVNAVLPEGATPMNNDGFYGLNSRAIIAVTVKAIQEQQAIIETQATEITNLKTENQNLNTLIQNLITRIEALENK